MDLIRILIPNGKPNGKRYFWDNKEILNMNWVSDDIKDLLNFLGVIIVWGDSDSWGFISLYL